MDVLSVGDVPWKKLAEKLGMMTLTHLYQDSPAPCRQLLHHYKVRATPTAPGCVGSDSRPHVMAPHMSASPSARVN